jgi:hypothetical protein
LGLGLLDEKKSVAAGDSMVRHLKVALSLSLWFLLSASLAQANSVELLNFIGLQSGQPVGTFYDGSGTAGTPNYGIFFSSNFIGLRPSSLNLGAGSLGPDPNSTPYIYISNSTLPGVMNVENGFTSGLNFFYASLANETVTVWSGINGTGTVLASMTLSASCLGSPTGCLWFDTGLHFSGTAQSVTFSGPGNSIGLSNITLGQSITAVPEPSSIYLFGIGLFCICTYQFRRIIRS